jgi:hypothetical protein
MLPGAVCAGSPRDSWQWRAPALAPWQTLSDQLGVDFVVGRASI